MLEQTKSGLRVKDIVLWMVSDCFWMVISCSLMDSITKDGDLTGIPSRQNPSVSLTEVGCWV